eukprot:2116116-Prymnesium_polylepis.1
MSGVRPLSASGSLTASRAPSLEEAKLCRPKLLGRWKIRGRRRIRCGLCVRQYFGRALPHLLIRGCGTGCDRCLKARSLREFDIGGFGKGVGGGNKFDRLPA